MISARHAKQVVWGGAKKTRTVEEKKKSQMSLEKGKGGTEEGRAGFEQLKSIQKRETKQEGKRRGEPGNAKQGAKQGKEEESGRKIRVSHHQRRGDRAKKKKGKKSAGKKGNRRRGVGSRSSGWGVLPKGEKQGGIKEKLYLGHLTRGKDKGEEGGKIRTRRAGGEGLGVPRERSTEKSKDGGEKVDVQKSDVGVWNKTEN